MRNDKSRGKWQTLADKAERQAAEFTKLAETCDGPKKKEAFLASANTYRERAAEYRRNAGGGA